MLSWLIATNLCKEFNRADSLEQFRELADDSQRAEKWRIKGDNLLNACIYDQATVCVEILSDG